MLRLVLLGFGLCLSLSVYGEVLFVADEFPAMQVLARRLQQEDGRKSQLIDQRHLPTKLDGFEAVVVYIHKELDEPAERVFIDYAKKGGRLVLLHHSISSGKRQNRFWFDFLGVKLPQGEVDQGGYKWIEGVTIQCVNLASSSWVMTNRVEYPQRLEFASGDTGGSAQLPGFTLEHTEVYLNHVLDPNRTVLMGLRYMDPKSGRVWMQKTAGWMRQADQGRVFYFMPGHTAHDFEDAVYGRIVLNAITAK
jgi:hypothetical protein